MLRLLCIGGACVALAFGAGCGDDDEDTGAGAAATQEGRATETTTATTETETETESETETGTAGASAGEAKVTMKNFQFVPSKLDGKVGEKVTWVNEDDAPHNAVQQNGGDLKTETFEKGGSDSYTLDEAGTIEYICTVHPQMHGTITVTR